MADSFLPLLIKGYNSTLSGGSDSITPTAASQNWQNVLDTGRGDLIGIDVLQTGRLNAIGSSSAINEDATASVLVGGVSVITECEVSDFALCSYPGAYFVSKLKQPGGQTLSWQRSAAATGVYGAQVLGFYENKAGTRQDVREALNTAKLKRRYQDFIFTGAGGIKPELSQQFTVPNNNGQVVGIQLLSYETAAGGTPPVLLNTGTVTFNGVNIFENVLIGYGNGVSTRPQIFPVIIEEGTTFQFSVDSSRTAAGDSYKFGVRLYFGDARITLPPTC